MVDIQKFINCGILCDKPNEGKYSLYNWSRNYAPITKWNTIISSAAKMLDYIFSNYTVNDIRGIFDNNDDDALLIKSLDNINISNYNTSSVIMMDRAFKGQSLHKRG